MSPLTGSTTGQDEARRMQNIREGVGCPHGRLYPLKEDCIPCSEFESSIMLDGMDPAED